MTAPITYDSLIPYVAVETPGCPDSTILLSLKRAAQDFFRDSETWRVEGGPVTTANEATVQLDVPSNTVLVAIYTLSIDGAQVYSTLPNTVHSADPDWINTTGLAVKGYWMVDPDSVRLYPIPSVSVDVQGYYSVMPTLDNTVLPGVVSVYSQALIHGALWKVLSIPAQQWSNPERGDYHGSQFNALSVQAKIRMTRLGANGLSVSLRGA